MIITIDGPAGSGKSTVARELAKALGIAFLDTGATYRAATLKAMREGVNLQDAAALTTMARAAKIEVIPQESISRVMLDGQDVTDDIRSHAVTENAHFIADSPPVREVLVALQRQLGAALGSFVAEGRDQGSVVFPQADFKFYLDASPAVRAQRRHRELYAAGETVELDDVLRSIEQRDRRDSTRPVAPLIQPPGAIVIDTSEMNIDQVTAKLLACLEVRR
ncbi:MAG: (d)CMP kinase [Phycisphaerae bacterium]